MKLNNINKRFLLVVDEENNTMWVYDIKNDKKHLINNLEVFSWIL